jgi:hypothetical protein
VDFPTVFEHIVEMHLTQAVEAGDLGLVDGLDTTAAENRSLNFLKRGCPGWGANPGPLNFIYFLIFHHLTAEPQRQILVKAKMNNTEVIPWGFSPPFF